MTSSPLEPPPSTPPDLTMGWMVHDIVLGGAAGLAAGVVAGMFGLRLVEHAAVPFLVGIVAAVLGAYVLARHGRGRWSMTPLRLVAWGVFVAAAGFLVVLYRTLDAAA